MYTIYISMYICGHAGFISRTIAWGRVYCKTWLELKVFQDACALATALALEQFLGSCRTASLLPEVLEGRKPHLVFGQ